MKQMKKLNGGGFLNANSWTYHDEFQVAIFFCRNHLHLLKVVYFFSNQPTRFAILTWLLVIKTKTSLTPSALIKMAEQAKKKQRPIFWVLKIVPQHKWAAIM